MVEASAPCLSEAMMQRIGKRAHATLRIGGGRGVTGASRLLGNPLDWARGFAAVEEAVKTGVHILNPEMQAYQQHCLHEHMRQEQARERKREREHERGRSRDFGIGR